MPPVPAEHMVVLVSETHLQQCLVLLYQLCTGIPQHAENDSLNALALYNTPTLLP